MGANRERGTVRRQNLEGGFWGIIADDGTNYLPVDGLPAEARREGVRIEFVARPVSVVSAVMWGTTISLSSVRVLDAEAPKER